MSTEILGGASRAAAPKPAFLRELEVLREQRGALSAERDYTIGGAIEQNVHREVNEQREARIRDLETTFKSMRGHVTNEFGVSQQREVAARAFERSR